MESCTHMYSWYTWSMRVERISPGRYNTTVYLLQHKHSVRMLFIAKSRYVIAVHIEWAGEGQRVYSRHRRAERYLERPALENHVVFFLSNSAQKKLCFTMWSVLIGKILFVICRTTTNNYHHDCHLSIFGKFVWSLKRQWLRIKYVFSSFYEIKRKTCKSDGLFHFILIRN